MMLGNCKFCRLAQGNEYTVTYEVIVDAILQIARNVSAKSKSGM